MSCPANSLDDARPAADEAEAGFRILDEWLQLETEHTDPGFVLPSQAAIVAWCEDHAPAIVLSANALLWAPVLAAMYFG
jgi:hypothetical protein